MKIMGEMVTIDQTSDLAGWLAVPASGSGRSLLVLHAWWGLTDFICELCDRLAETGFTTLAPDLYHGNTATSIAEAEQLRNGLDSKQAKSEQKMALRYLRSHPAALPGGTGVIGFSLGANFACTLAREAPPDVTSVVLFYGTGGGLYDKTNARFQAHFAGHDPYESKQAITKMEARLQKGGREFEFFTYPGAGHWFFESDRPEAFDPVAAQLAWERMVNFLNG